MNLYIFQKEIIAIISQNMFMRDIKDLEIKSRFFGHILIIICVKLHLFQHEVNTDAFNNLKTTSLSCPMSWKRPTKSYPETIMVFDCKIIMYSSLTLLWNNNSVWDYIWPYSSYIQCLAINPEKLILILITTTTWICSKTQLKNDV